MLATPKAPRSGNVLFSYKGTDSSPIPGHLAKGAESSSQAGMRPFVLLSRDNVSHLHLLSGGGEAVKSCLIFGKNESWTGVLNFIPVNGAAALKLLWWKWRLSSIRPSEKGRHNNHMGVTFLKGIPASEQAVETLLPHTQKSREWGWRITIQGQRYSATIIQVKWKPNVESKCEEQNI